LGRGKDEDHGMKIYMCAGHHDNPLHRKRLEICLIKLNQKAGRPEFIAVEAHEVLFPVVIRYQRDHFVKLAQKDDVLQKIDIALLQKLASAISYEADTHADVFKSEVNTVWLDNARRDFSTVCDPCTMATRYLARCRSAVLNAQLELTSYLREHQLFEAIDAIFEKELGTTQTKPEAGSTSTCDRDKAWMTLLQGFVVDSGPSAYGIVIAGSDHAQDKPDYIRYLLSKAGHDCEVCSLSCQPQRIRIDRESEAIHDLIL
jgi:hypothetical protein